MFCREQAARLGERMEEIEGRGAQLIAIGNGHARWAQAFIGAEDIKFPVYVDPGRQTYEEFGMTHGKKVVFNRRTKAHSERALDNGFRQSSTRGDPFQNGGVIVFDESGQIVYSHIEEVAGDLANLDEVIAALG